MILSNGMQPKNQHRIPEMLSQSCFRDDLIKVNAVGLIQPLLGVGNYSGNFILVGIVQV